MYGSLHSRTSDAKRDGSSDYLSFNPRQAFSRQASVILANTGERVRRDVTLSNLSMSVHTPLLHSEQLPPTPSLSARASYYYHHPVVRSVLKASIAYLIASLGVYYTPFNNMLGQTDSKHVVATVAVYFHPSRSIGSMHQTLGFAVVCILYSFSVSVLCRSLSSYVYGLGLDELASIIDLVVCSTALGVVAFFKQRVNKATFNTACSLSIISLVGCIIKEGATNAGEVPLDKIDASLRVICCGCVITVAVCYLVWPVRAVRSLRSSLNDSYNLMSACLSRAVSGFLTGERLTPKDLEVFKALKKNVSSLKNNLAESKYELRVVGREQEWRVLEELVAMTIELTNHISALKTSLDIQYRLLGSPHSETTSIESLDSYTSDILRLSQSVENLTFIESGASSLADNEAENSRQLFEMFCYYLSPSIKSFVFTVKGVLGQVPFEKYREDQPRKFASTAHLQSALNDALDLFRLKQEESFEKLYAQDLFHQPADFIFKADQEEVAACCGNFVSMLSLYGEGLMKFIKLSETYEDCRASSRRWPWLKFWSKPPSPILVRNQSQTLHAAITGFQNQIRYSRRPRPPATPPSWRLWMWRRLRVLRRVDVQYGIRVGLGSFALGSFAFWKATRTWFLEWRIEWALTIYCIMMNKSLGGTTSTVKWRFIGTFLGSFIAYVVWDASDANVYALAIAGFLLAIPSFYIIMFWKQNNPFGRFILLTYNLTALYSYSMLQHDNEDGNEGGENPIIAAIAIHRFIAVSIGIVWAILMSVTFFPNSARSRLKTALVLLWLRMGIVWDSNPLDSEHGRLIGLKGSQDIQSLVAECETLAKQAALEFRLKGRFPKVEYDTIILHSQKIVDAFENFNIMVKVDPRLNSSEAAVITSLAGERSELEHRIFLIFYTLASAVKLGFPLPSKPASPDHAKDRMLYQLSKIRGEPATPLRNEDFILLYSYILVSTVIVDELDDIMAMVRRLLGDISEEIFELV
ncbi:hypothetical protein DIURU_002754 [Diutina rugosa]|uniref:Integral membrane bound transporter domain-containing protein n=1 Tax=Diutina rugosa TaxID=5481 RepID=A0A642UP55_DIURU|nr:uncharacterized protein DIURU_002754 [Diutina rugosa]KAA8902645.1 hypothetical protein DIURU_002754 [Diutina rugosa]